METKSAAWISLKYLLSSVGDERKSQLETFLSSDMLKRLEETPLATANPFEQKKSLEERLSQIHYTWHIPFLSPLSKHDKVYIIAALNPRASEPLSHFFKMENSNITLTTFAKTFAEEILFQKVISDEENYLPIEYLPENPLNLLLDLSKEVLISLIDYLGLYDLSTEIKQLVQVSKIKLLQEMLSQTQMKFLREIKAQKDLFSTTPLGLEKWDGDLDQLKKVLHHRGLNRLAKALYGATPALVWHITRHLDTGRAKVFQKLCRDINNEKAQDALVDQVIHLTTFLKNPKGA
ncbi:MAG: hypothetical protein KAR79_00160 [Simkaniaceae bacterium]|nr:hypothetical protein [Simkaniaceae bacterium]